MMLMFTLHNCCPVDSSSNGCLEKHFEQANKTTCELIFPFSIASLLWSLVICWLKFSSTSGVALINYQKQVFLSKIHLKLHRFTYSVLKNFIICLADAAICLLVNQNCITLFDFNVIVFYTFFQIYVCYCDSSFFFNFMKSKFLVLVNRFVFFVAHKIFISAANTHLFKTFLKN